MQSVATIITGAIIGLAFQWKLALVGIACMPVLVSAGYIRLVKQTLLLFKVFFIDIIWLARRRT